MANTTSLDQLADAFPAVLGWLKCNENFTSTITLNGSLLAYRSDTFPLQARVRIYSAGELITEFFSPEIELDSLEIINLNQKLNGRAIQNGYVEVSVFTKNPKAMERTYFNEVWGSVYSKDGRTAVNFPLLISRGADPSMIDSTYLYYPGVHINESYGAEILGINHLSRDNEFEISLHNAEGTETLSKTIMIPAHTLERYNLESVFPEASKLLQSGPGMMVVHMKYKMQAYILTTHRQRNTVVGMDHLGLLFALTREAAAKEKKADRDRARTNAALRLEDPLVCYCKGISRSQLLDMKAQGYTVKKLDDEHNIGGVCVGCVPELEELFALEKKL